MKIEDLKIGDRIEAVILSTQTTWTGTVTKINLYDNVVTMLFDGRKEEGVFFPHEIIRIINRPPTDRYYVYNKTSGGGPRRIHETEESARLEAERLSRQHVGSTFEVLKIVASCKTDMPQVNWSDNWEEPLPF